MIVLILITVAFCSYNSEALDQFKKDQDLGAEWHYVGKQDLDTNAKAIDINDKIYYKLKHKEIDNE